MMEILDEYYLLMRSRIIDAPEDSYVKHLFNTGSLKIAQKLGEESVELVLEIATENKERAVQESADVIFHMLVAWAFLEIKPCEIWSELQSRKLRQ